MAERNTIFEPNMGMEMITFLALCVVFVFGVCVCACTCAVPITFSVNCVGFWLSFEADYLWVSLVAALRNQIRVIHTG